jgi:aromatase
MTTPVYREVEHEIVVNADAPEVYRMLAGVESWPQLFPPSVYVDYLERDGNSERIRIWAMANGEAKSWTSRRVLDPAALRIRFWQEVSAPPVAEMSGTWIMEPLGERRTRLRLLHEYRAVDDDPAGLAWIDRAVDTNSRAELPSLKASVEQAAQADELTLSFADTVWINGSAKDVYDFINDAHLWPERLPHVTRVTLTEDAPGLQVLRMETLTRDGSAHTTESVRVCLPYHKIAYKQTTLPALMSVHTGYWLLEQSPDDPTRVAATSQHTVVINPANITKVLGPDAGLSDAREFVHRALSANSMATLTHAGEYAESCLGRSDAV